MFQSLRGRAKAPAFGLLLVLVSSAYAYSQPAVKLSRSGICHATDSRSYSRTKSYTAFSNLRECLKQGRLPKNYIPSSGVLDAQSHEAKASQQEVSSSYDRNKFGSWIDEDRDCQNTRHELLGQLSTKKPSYTSNGCRVLRGRWLDPYTDKVFLDASKLDVDHLVPLKWAWDHGAISWSNSERKRFANDQRNLFAVQASVNREKGAKGPLTWLPPNSKFQCEYVNRFKRIMLMYKLRFSSSEATRYMSVRDRVCG